MQILRNSKKPSFDFVAEVQFHQILYLFFVEEEVSFPEAVLVVFPVVVVVVYLPFLSFLSAFLTSLPSFCRRQC